MSNQEYQQLIDKFEKARDYYRAVVSLSNHQAEIVQQLDEKIDNATNDEEFKAALAIYDYYCDNYYAVTVRFENVIARHIFVDAAKALFLYQADHFGVPQRAIDSLKAAFLMIRSINGSRKPERREFFNKILSVDIDNCIYWL